MLKGLRVLALAVALEGAQPQQQAKPERMDGAELFAAYAGGGGDQLLARAFPTQPRFEAFRNDFRDRVLTEWEGVDRTPIRAMFMLDIAIASLNRGYYYWADFIYLGSGYIRRRADPPGANASFDAFEILWHKTAVALLQGRRRPDLVADTGVSPLKGRMETAPPLTDSTPAPRPVLVDPWIALARGFAEEGFAIDMPATLDKRGAAALDHYREALEYEATRAEATLRSAWLLVRMKRAAEALALLDACDDRWTNDAVFLYWRRLFRGKALDTLDRPDEAMRAYEDALTFAPTAHSPRVGMMAIEFKRNRTEAAEGIATALGRTPDPVIDPWWTYDHGDWRFFPARLRALKAMVGR